MSDGGGDQGRPSPSTAFVLGGGGKWGAVEVGMLQSLVDHGVVADLVVGCSIGAVNGAVFAADPTAAGVARMASFWTGPDARLIVTASWMARLRSLVGRRASLYDNSGLRAAVEALVPARFEELVLPFECVAATIETASERWFGAGGLVDALMASCAIPGLFPPVEIDDLHYYDGGLVDSIPLDRALVLGATRVFVLQVGRVEQPLEPPHRLHQAALVAFEIARRHRFATVRHGVPSTVQVHVLPSGHQLSMDDRRQLAWRRTADAPALVDAARVATDRYLDSLEVPPE